jgi:hypothetical protein
MRSKQLNCMGLLGAADVRRRACRRSFVLQVRDNKADAVPCERLQYIVSFVVDKETDENRKYIPQSVRRFC